MGSKVRLDVAMVERGLVESRQKAQAIIMSGIVYVNGQWRIEPDPVPSVTPEGVREPIRRTTARNPVWYCGRGAI